MELILQQKQTMNLMMTTELRQAIELLQYSTYDLLQHIREQEEENPFIELVERGYEGPMRSNRSHRRSSHSDEVDPLDFISSEDKDAYDHLIDQLKWMKINEREKDIVQYLILNLNESGYLTITDDELQDKLEIDQSTLDEAINVLQSLEPTGVGGRDLADCLLIQASHFYPDEKDVQLIIQNHLEDLANRRWDHICEALNISLKEIKQAQKIIQTLDPKPITIVSNEQVKYLNPDIIVDIDEKTGHFQVHLNDYYIPNVRFNKDFLEGINESDKEVTKYVNEHYKRYQWLINSIEQRRNTILKIMKVLLEEQVAFFKSGLKALKPLTLKDVANKIDMHESTVSRATANKVVQTPNGAFELRKLFSTRLNQTSGEDTSQATVKMLLQEVVDNEDKYKPLSDQKIADLLKEENDIKISRRTVAKYRNELNIPASTRRREIKV